MTFALREFGSYFVGGRLHRVDTGRPFEVQVTRDSSYTYDPKGHFAVEHAYVQYFTPERRRDAPPVVLVHGGGMHGATWETTPDEREGWLHLLLRRGYETHVVDAMERGRAGWAPDLWEGAPLLRSMEEAWSLFRFGPPDGFSARRAYARQQFPIERLEAFARSFTPRWLSTTALQVSALTAVLERVGPALLITHSQGGEIGFDALARRPDLVSGLVAIEPSAAPSDIAVLRACPTVLVIGDYLDVDAKIDARNALWLKIAQDAAKLGAPLTVLHTARDLAPGGSHMLMMDRHNEDCLAAALATLNL